MFLLSVKMSHLHRLSYVVIVVLAVVTYGSEVEVSIDVDSLVHKVSERYLSVALGSSIVRERWAHWDFSSDRLQTLAAGLSPAYMRLGGTDADFLIFDPTSHSKWQRPNRNSLSKDRSVQLDSCDGWRYCKPKYRTNFTMTADDWDQINRFSKRAGWRLLFDFNVFLSEGKLWSVKNARSLLDYSTRHGYMSNLDFELGNEPNAYFHNFNISMSGSLLGKDFIELSKLIREFKSTSSSLLVGPDITRPRGRHSKSLTFLKQFLPVAESVVDAITWHQYYLNGRTAIMNNFTDPGVLNLLKKQLRMVRKSIKSAHGQEKRVWLGETSSAWGGGAKGLSDTYVAGFMWLDKLGLSALGGVDTVIRQTFFRAHYALVDDAQRPRPDYWLSLLYKRLVGTKVLRVSVNKNADFVRLYAHCTNTPRSGHPVGSVTLYGMNLLDEDVTLDVTGHFRNATLQQYLLTPHTNGKLSSALVKLNGKTLKMPDDFSFPPLIPKMLKSNVVLPSKTFGFYVFPPTGTLSNVCLQ